MQNKDSREIRNAPSLEPWNGARRFFSNPVVGIVGSIASIVGLFLAVYFFVQSKQHRDLVYRVNPAKAVIVKSGQLSKLAVTFDGKPIDTDVAAAQVAFWNQGNQSIRKENVLQWLTLQTIPITPIIDATVRKTSRDIVHVDLDKGDLQSGKLGISWNILEQGDGAIVQVIFAGSPATNITAKSIIEGQQNIRAITGSALQLPAEKDPFRDRRFMRYLSIAYILLGIFMAVYALLRKRMYPLPRTIRLLWIMSIMTIILGASLFLLLPSLEPPFGF